MTDDRSRVLRRVGILLLVANVALALLKGGAWVATGSLAVQSEAINSASDAVYSLVTVAGLYLTTRPPDFEHPHGHERIEPFVGLFVALGIFVAGGTVLYQSATALLSGDVTVSRGPTAVAVLVVAAVAKFALYRYVLAAADRHNSPALTATAVDNRNDILTASAAIVGVLGAGAGYPVLDPLAAMVVAVGIVYTGIEVVRDNLGYLLGRAPPEDLRREIIRRALEHPDVEGAHDVIAHYVGPEIDVSLHIEVQGERTLYEAHDIESAVVDSIRDLPEVDDVFVHVDPRELDEWKPDEEVDQLADDRWRSQKE
ncbi:cation diffusion facilitator family transporter [Halosimplex pelagicum]|uniref:Cation transporter n=1 Tax=Halosimplex pelagicum TaxID=869886 RepID=A0A7D5TAA1_9EURY|nr:cation diffusion facilitator family transporter [Halosimplex pelagicum]QLH80375.1 cation transporter [Halosimplex pelagicum]